MLLALATLIVAAWTAFGRGPLADGDRVTVSEAAALQDSAEIVRQLARGADLREATVVRAGIIRDQDLMMTPIEAAVTEGRADVVQLLFDSGVVVDRPQALVLWCLAAGRGDAVVFRVLTAHLGAIPAVDCAALPTPLNQP